jgi:tRNA A-37 threonylcarbamoyl transferase component Bud32
MVPPPPESAPPLEEIARQFPQLEVLECLGRGGMGVVYKARQPRLNRFVALKILAREKEKDPRFAERFTREAQALARLNHPNIVTVYDFGETNGLYYLLMEFVDGMSLRQLLQSRKLAPEEALVIVPSICVALQYAHEQGIVHRDIKPENILLDKQGRVKIADFGIAKLLGADGKVESLTGEQGVVGTPHYMAPEQVEKPSIVDHRADIFSGGCVLRDADGRAAAGEIRAALAHGEGGCPPGRGSAACAGKGAWAPLPARQSGQDGCGDDCDDIRGRHRASAATSPLLGRGPAGHAATTRHFGKTDHRRRQRCDYSRDRPGCGWLAEVAFGPDCRRVARQPA